ncbi:MAG: succinate--CoA ligase subunit alpha [Candidatus Coatesbacteria bacterium RBG_13_66_14]|uniref:Succinate--CoA ligase [ADP-forming] subunit alpha n=1 Tax=Candidatus Coatesbacteria bacterium RBG_13_66_14 TaxID=1817816 RepID=A0A1F5FHE4_9BACT|nr:MAG: succinate--CoA ligase subunit alpha [Candidatus Coatesbacteria bacterium RBG_13_66_14]
MAILVDENSRVLVQGVTGKTGRFHASRMLSYGTRVVAGISPGKGGQEVEGVPVFDTVAEAVEATGADVSVLFLPARYVLDSAVEACRAGLRLVVVVPEHIPVHDMLRLREESQKSGTQVLGGNTAGVISPGRCNVGIIPPLAFERGRVGTLSRSGSITYYIADTLTRSGYGESTCVGMGGDPVLGSTYNDLLPLFDADDGTDAVVITGEIGGIYEELSAPAIRAMKKPVVAMIGGVFAPLGKRMGHAGAIVEGRMGTAESKFAALEGAGASIAKTFEDIPRILGELGIRPANEPHVIEGGRVGG